MARLKVFTWADGFHAFTVATGSRPKALKAWGIKADIFKSGLAREINEGPDYDAALASPEQVVQRGLSIDVDAIRPVRTNKPTAAAVKTRAKIMALEAELSDLDQAHDEASADLDRRRAALERESQELDAAYASDRASLAARLKTARGKV